MKYAYVNGNPLGATDPLGLDFMDRMADRAAGIPEGRPGDQYKLPSIPKDFNKDPCVQEYVQNYYGNFAANTMVPGFSLLSYVPGSGTAGQAWKGTAISLVTKGALVGAPLALASSIDAWSLATGMAGGQSSSTMLSIGSGARTFALRSGQGLAVAGTGAMAYATTANVMALSECGCKR